MPQADYIDPSPSNLSKSSVSALAEKVALDLGYTPGAELEPLVKKLGGDVVFQDFWDLDDSSSGSIKIESRGEFKIYLGLHTSPDRDRFTIGHEIGHYILHYLYPVSKGQQIGRMQAARYGSGRVEYEANWFAASFLMPSAGFTEAYLASCKDIFEVANLFRVSVSAASVRARVLKLEP
jgi:hypothetical protein